MKLIYIITFVLILSCSSKEVKIPKDIIQKDEMIALYIDIHITDAMVTQKKIKDVKISNQLKKSYLVSVLKKHNLTMELFEKSNAFYEDNIQLKYDLYNEVMVKISEKEALLEELEKEKK